MSWSPSSAYISGVHVDVRDPGWPAKPNEPRLTLPKSVWARCQSRSRSGSLPNEKRASAS